VPVIWLKFVRQFLIYLAERDLYASASLDWMRHNVLNLSVRPSVRPFVCLLQSCEHAILKKNEPILLWFTRQVWKRTNERTNGQTENVMPPPVNLA